MCMLTYSIHIVRLSWRCLIVLYRVLLFCYVYFIRLLGFIIKCYSLILKISQERIKNILITSERSGRSFFRLYMVEVSCNSTRLEQNRIGLIIRFLRALYIVNYTSHKFYKLKENRKIFYKFLNKLTFMGIISPKTIRDTNLKQKLKLLRCCGLDYVKFS